MRKQTKKFWNKLNFRLILALLLLLIIPFYAMLHFLQISYREYIEQELSERIISTIAKGEEDIRAVFQNMAAVTNVFSMDQNWLDAVKNDQTTYYDRTVAFDEVVSKINITNLFKSIDMHFFFVDRKGQSYTDVGTSGISTSDSAVQELISDAQKSDGHLVWKLFAPISSTKSKDPNQYVSVSRAILSEGVFGNYVGTLIAYIDQTEIGDILSQYRVGENDFIYLCLEEGKTLFYLDENQFISPVEIENKVQSLKEQAGYETLSLQDRKYIMSYYRLYQPWGFTGEPMKVLYFTEYSQIVQTFDSFARRMDFILIVYLLALAFISVLLSFSVTRPISRLEKCMKLFSENRTVTIANLNRKDEIGSLSKTFYEMEIKINELFSQLKKETEIREKYHYQALRAQINPHFLFNTLNTIRWMAILRKADNITEMLDALGTILKYSMEREGEIVLLSEELEMIRQYVFIQNYRYGKECLLLIDVPEELQQQKIIKFILQPIVENSFIHAFKNFKGRPKIHISGQRRDSMMCLCVEDNGIGVDVSIPERLRQFQLNERKKITGLGLGNVDERIRIEYGNDYGIEIKKAGDAGTIVEYRLPFISRGSEEDEEDTHCR